LTSTGRGADIMIPMAIPTFGGMLFEVMTMLVVPVLYCWKEEIASNRRIASAPVEKPILSQDIVNA